MVAEDQVNGMTLIRRLGCAKAAANQEKQQHEAERCLQIRHGACALACNITNRNALKREGWLVFCGVWGRHHVGFRVHPEIPLGHGHEAGDQILCQQRMEVLLRMH